MDKNTKILLGVGALAVVGYFVWKNNQSPKANASGSMLSTNPILVAKSPGCPCQKPAPDQSKAPNGWELCKGVGDDGLPDKMCRKNATKLEKA